MKRISQIGEEFSREEVIGLLREIEHLRTEGLWPKHAPHFNDFVRKLIFEGYPTEGCMSFVINWAKDWAVSEVLKKEIVKSC